MFLFIDSVEMKAQPAVGVIPLGTGEMTKTTIYIFQFSLFFLIHYISLSLSPYNVLS